MTAIAALEEQAVAFAAQVRSQLADLPAEDLDDLLDGLEADLAERLADGGQLGDPEQYAAELRQAAGLPSRAEVEAESGAQRPRRALAAVLTDTAGQLARDVARFWDDTPQRRAIRDFIVSLRPVWWVLRALVVAGAVLFFLGIPYLGLYMSPYSHGIPVSWGSTLLIVACTLLSVQWGRGKWAPNRWIVGLRRLGNAFALIALVPVAVLTQSVIATPVYVQPSAAGWGLNVDGDQITNIFAYDCSGAPIDAVQLYDQHGNELTTSRYSDVSARMGLDETSDQSIMYFPNGAVIGDSRWNTFPLAEARWTSSTPFNESQLRNRAEAAKWPFTQRAPLNSACAAAVSSDMKGGANADKTDTSAAAASANGGGSDSANTPPGTEAAPTPKE